MARHLISCNAVQLFHANHRRWGFFGSDAGATGDDFPRTELGTRTQDYDTGDSREILKLLRANCAREFDSHSAKNIKHSSAATGPRDFHCRRRGASLLALCLIYPNVMQILSCSNGKSLEKTQHNTVLTGWLHSPPLHFSR